MLYCSSQVDSAYLNPQVNLRSLGNEIILTSLNAYDTMNHIKSDRKRGP